MRNAQNNDESGRSIILRIREFVMAMEVRSKCIVTICPLCKQELSRDSYVLVLYSPRKSQDLLFQDSEIHHCFDKDTPVFVHLSYSPT